MLPHLFLGPPTVFHVPLSPLASKPKTERPRQQLPITRSNWRLLCFPLLPRGSLIMNTVVGGCKLCAPTNPAWQSNEELWRRTAWEEPTPTAVLGNSASLSLVSVTTDSTTWQDGRGLCEVGYIKHMGLSPVEFSLPDISDAYPCQ